MYIELKDINKTFGNYKASDHVEFGIEKGKLVALLGPSGSGKTTILRMIAGLEHQDSGDIYIDGKCVNELLVRERGIGFVFQNYALFPYMTVFDNVAYGLKVRKEDKKVIEKRVEELLELVDLKGLEKRYPTQLSGGQRQRVAIARSLCMEPEFLVADEPIASLDVSIQAQIVNLFRHLQEEHGFTFLFIAHDLAMVEYLCDRVGVMYHGKLVELAPSEELYSNPVHPYTKTLLSAIPVPDPIRERKRVLQYYDGEGMENSVWTEVSPGHFAMLPAEGKGCSI